MESATAVEYPSSTSCDRTLDEDDFRGDVQLNQFAGGDLGQITTDSDTSHAGQEEEHRSPSQLAPDPAQKGQFVDPDRSKEQFRRDVEDGKLIMLSLVFAALLPLVMWCSRAQLLLMVWRLNLMVCLYVYLWASIFSATRRMFCYISYGALLAFWADAVLSPVVGVLLINLNSVFGAVLLGDAFAQNRQSRGRNSSDQGKEEFPPVGKPILTVILALLLPIVIWYNSSQPLFAIWRISSLLCFGLIIWARFLLAATRLIFCVSYGALLAFAADALISPVFGVMVVYLNSVYAAGLFGCCYAEYRERIGKEKAATVAEERRTLQEKWKVGSCSIVFLLALGCAVHMAWVVCHPADYPMEVVVIYMSYYLCLLLLTSIGFVLQMLHREGLTIISMAFFYIVVVGMICAILGLYVHLIAMWIIDFGLASALGYWLRVYSSYMQMRSF